MHKLLLSMLLAAAGAWPQPSSMAGAVGGVVRDAGTLTPLAGVRVSLNMGTSPAVQTTTDSQGHYELRNLAAGTHRLLASWGEGLSMVSAVRTVALAAGQNITSADIHVQTYGEITGKVLDENKEPVPNVWVALVAREYDLGVLRYIFASIATTNDQGSYRLQRVVPGRAYLILAQKRPGKIETVSRVPADPEARKRVLAPTYYPESTALDGAQSLVLRVGEQRDGVDIHVSHVPAYCIEGVLEDDGGPAALQFEIVADVPSGGQVGGSSIYPVSPQGEPGPDGKIRLCELPSGDYRISLASRGAENSPAPSSFGTTLIAIADEDVRKVHLSIPAPLSVAGEVAWDGAPPDKAVESELIVALTPTRRIPWRGEIAGLHVKSSIPGEFVFPSLLLDEYAVYVRNVPAGLYVKDITYGGASVLREPLRVGSAPGDSGLRVVLARDGATLQAKVADQDGHPVADAYVLILPAAANSEAALSAAFLSGQTDQNGAYAARALAPGKYLVLATTAPVDHSPESVAKLWRIRSQIQTVDVSPRATVPLTLAPRTLD